MKEFLEKRWWGGIGVIIALMLGLPALIQYFGKVSISWLAVTIALNIILVIVLLLVAIWNTKLKRKYEDASSRLKKVVEIINNQMEEQKKDTKRKKRKMVLLPDPNYIWKLNIDNSLLTQLYGEAHGFATTKFHDVKLNSLSIHVHPYNEEDRVSILFYFYSRWADRECTYITSELGRRNELLSDRPAKIEMDRFVLDELPWLRDTNWPEFLRKSCEKVGPLSPDRWTNYYLSTQAQLPPLLEFPWRINFEDGVTGKEFGFSWDGKGEPIPDEVIQKALRIKLKSWLKIKKDK